MCTSIQINGKSVLIAYTGNVKKLKKQFPNAIPEVTVIKKETPQKFEANCVPHFGSFKRGVHPDRTWDNGNRSDGKRGRNDLYKDRWLREQGSGLTRAVDIDF